MIPAARLRLAAAADTADIAALHASSWRSAYRGIFSDAYLDGPVEADRLQLWQSRLADPAPPQIVLLAEDAGGALAGFVCGFVDADPRWGSYINNLHVSPDRKGAGIGRALLAGLGVRFADRAAERPVHLFCLEDNRNGRRFYASIGGAVVERAMSVEADGTRCIDLRFAWPSPADLVSAVTPRAA